MRSFRAHKDDRRRIFLALTGSVESKLREAYEKLHSAGRVTQAGLAEKLGVNRSAVHRRLNGAENMTLKTVADMVWGLGYCIEVDIFDPRDRPERNDLVRADLDEAKPLANIAEVNFGGWGDAHSSGAGHLEVRSGVELVGA